MSPFRDAPPEVLEILGKYLDIQDEERELRRRKTLLQKRLWSYMQGDGSKVRYTDVGAQRVRVHYDEREDVVYNEEELRRRLGDDYTRVLSPDARRVKAMLPELGSLLAPFIDRVGAPDTERIASLVQRGVLDRRIFRGTFHRELKQQVKVSRVERDVCERQSERGAGPAGYGQNRAKGAVRGRAA